MRPIVKGESPADLNGNAIKFTEYSRSRRYLIDRIGEYCSYCERKIEANLAVEHVRPKSLNPDLALEWSNFLLGCTNCNSTKGNKPIVLNNFVWPDIDNTYIYFSYDDTGIVNISNTVNNQDLRVKIQNVIDLVGLQKYPPRIGTSDWERASDRRFEQRIQAWFEANHFIKLYDGSDENSRRLMIPFIVTIVVYQGFWSIWMKVFNDFPEVQIEIINSYKGTRTEFFPNLFPVT